MSNDPFRPFSDDFSQETALSILKDATDGADDGELFLERRRSEALVFDDGRLKTASFDASEGFGLRAVKGEVSGYAHSTELSEAALRRASDTARLAVGDGGGTLADAPMATNRKLYTDDDPISGVSFPVKIETLREIDAFARDLDPRVVQVSATLAASLQEVEILRPDGVSVRDTRPMTRVNVSVIVEENGRRESGSAGGGGRIGLDGLIDPADWQAKAREALRIAVVNLGAEAAPAGVMDVVLGPGWPGILLHEAVGHGLEGDFNRKGTSAFAGLMGQQVAAKGVTVRYRASLEQDIAAVGEYRPDLAIGTTPVVQHAKQRGLPAMYFTNLISARPLIGAAGAGSLAQVVNSAIGNRERFARMTGFFAGVGEDMSAGIWEDTPQDRPQFKKKFAARNIAARKASEAVGV